MVEKTKNEGSKQIFFLYIYDLLAQVLSPLNILY
jgi:hypothetical protein